MPELPEVETVRRLLAAHVVGRTIGAVRLSGLDLREPLARHLPRRLAGRKLIAVHRHGKYLLMELDRGITVLSHLGMSGRWLFHRGDPGVEPPHVHVRIRFRDGTQLWFQDPRRFGLLRAVRSGQLAADPSLARLGPDPVAEPPTGPSLHARARGARVSVKAFLLDQRRLAGIGNIYASEILHRAGVDPRVRAGRLSGPQWAAIAREITAVLGEAIDRFGTTFSMYRTLWNEPGSYGDQLRVYDRSGEPCQTCRTPIQRIVQGARATFFCPRCQSRAARIQPPVAPGAQGKPVARRPGPRRRPPARPRS